MTKAKRTEGLKELLLSRSSKPASGGTIEAHEGMRALVTEILDLVDSDPSLPRPTLEMMHAALAKFFPNSAPRSTSSIRKYLLACEAERYKKLCKCRGR